MRQLLHALLTLACALPLVGAGLAAQDGSPTAAERFDALEAEVEEAHDAWRAELDAKRRAAAKSGETLPRSAYERPYKPFIQRFQAAARDYSGSEGAVPFLVWLAAEGVNVDRDAANAALVTLLEAHVESPGLEPVAHYFPRMAETMDDKEAARLVARAEAASPVASVRAWAIFARLQPTLLMADITSAKFKAAKQEMLGALEGVGEGYLTDRIKLDIEVREVFSLGMTAPDIVGVDLDGTAFKLSDYKGQVLMVDFWGDW